MSTGTPSTVHKAHASAASGGNGRSTVVAKTYPAPAQLATPTDLTAQEPQTITAGLQGELYTEVTGGVGDGDQVVTFGSFFIDSEYKLKGAAQGQ